MTHQQSLSRELSEWAMRLRFDQAPADARQAIANCLLYNLTMGLAVDDSNDQLGRALRSIADANGTARLFRGRGTRNAADTAFINAGLITARGQNDTHPQVVTHMRFEIATGSQAAISVAAIKGRMSSERKIWIARLIAEELRASDFIPALPADPA